MCYSPGKSRVGDHTLRVGGCERSVGADCLSQELWLRRAALPLAITPSSLPYLFPGPYIVLITGLFPLLKRHRRLSLPYPYCNDTDRIGPSSPDPSTLRFLRSQLVRSILLVATTSKLSLLISLPTCYYHLRYTLPDS